MKFRYLAALLVLVGTLLIPQAAWASDDLVQSGDIIIAESEKILGDVVCLQGNVDIYGEVFGDVVALMGNVTVHPGGLIHGDVVTLLGVVDLHPEGRIGGDQVSLGGIGQHISLPSPKNLFNVNLGFTVFNIIVRFGLAVLIAALFPAVQGRVSAQIEKRAGQSAGAGVLAWLAVLPLTIVVALTIIGIPLSLLLLLVLWAAFFLGFSAVSALAGARILTNQKPGSLVPVALGSIVLSVLIAFPVVGWLIRIALALVGVGAVVITRFGTQTQI